MNYQLSGLPKDVESIQKGTSILIEDICPVSPYDCLNIHVIFTENNTLSVSRTNHNISITYHQPAHYFRGLNWALHHLDGNTAAKSETVYFKSNGVMLDSSRNAVSKVEKIKSFIRTQARLGMNILMLYTEDTYEIPQEPYFGAYRGRYSQEEIREIDAYARLFGIEMIPCIQTLAHVRNALKWPMGTDIKDTPDILLVGEEKVYILIENMLRSLKDSFSTNRVHLGMDEAVELGLGKYLKKHGYQKSSLLIKEHCSRVLDICKKLELEPMMWSDMYLCSNTGGEYYTECDLSKIDGLVKPERGLGMVYWDYYHADENVYDYMLKNHKVLSDSVIFAGGSWIWNGISPNYSRTFLTTIPALRSCKKHGIQEVFCTAWQDNGAETPVDAVLPGIALFAHLGFHEEMDEALLKEEFHDAVDGEFDDFYQLEFFDSLFVGAGNNMTSDNPSKYLLYQDALLGMFDNHIKDVDTTSYYGSLAPKLAKCQETSPAYKDLFRFYELLALTLEKKADLGICIKNAYDSRDLSTLQKISQETIPQLLELIRKMKDVREKIWLHDAKAFGYELLDIKLGSVITRLESNQRRLNSYLKGEVTSLEELEHPRLPFFNTEVSVGHPTTISMSANQWDKIVSGCNIIDTI